MHDPEYTFKAEEIYARIPKFYHDNINVFSKIDSNILLPLRRAPDYRIKLDRAV